MKTLFKLLSITFFALILFTSCQDEIIEETTPNEQEALVTNSPLATAMRATATRDGSFDNIIDQANCLSVELPVTVMVNGLEIIIDSEEDYEVIEAIFDQFDSDDDVLEIIFPIVIILSDFTEITINNQEELQAFIADCSGEDEIDDDIECIDFQYPISISIFDSQFQIIDTITINNDEELYNFIEHELEDNVLASLNYPITMILSDGSTITVHNNTQLEAAIRAAEHECDEDDDNDFNDDDFNLDGLDNLLMSCPWIIRDIHRNDNDLSHNYRDYVMVFKEDGVVKVRARNGDIITGQWETEITNQGAKIILEFNSIVDFTLQWFVYEIEDGKIKLHTDGGNHIVLRKACDIVVNHTIDRIENILTECYWRIKRLRIDGVHHEDDYIGTPFKFFNDGIVKIRINGEDLQGTWEVLSFSAGFVLKIVLDERPELRLEWLITFLDSNVIKLENQDSTMVLKKHCPDTDADVMAIKAALNAGTWEVAFYEDEGVNETELFNGFVIDFLESGAVLAEDSTQLIDGSWLVYRNDDGRLKLGLNFGLEPPFDEINHRWKIVEITENHIELKDYHEDGTLERILIFEKL